MSAEDQSSQWVLLTVKLKEEHPTIAQAADATGLAVSAFDEGFGVVAVDLREELFAVQVRASAIADMAVPEDSTVSGPFSNVRIEPFK